MDDKLTIREVLIRIRASLSGLSVTGPANAGILAAACTNLDTVIGIIAGEEAKARDSEKDNRGDV